MSPSALDEANHLCLWPAARRNFVVIDTQTGKEVTAFAITKEWTDLGLMMPPASAIYAACGWRPPTYMPADLTRTNITNSSKVAHAGPGRQRLLVPELSVIVVAVPATRNKRTPKFLGFEVQ